VDPGVRRDDRWRQNAGMSDEVFIYAIVLLNVMVQLLLITRLKFPPGGKRKYVLLAIAVPLAVIGVMRLLIWSGAMPAAVAEQSLLQRGLTLVASLALVAGPWAVTVAAILDKKRRAALRPA
jgi:hypothetical protein